MKAKYQISRDDPNTERADPNTEEHRQAKFCCVELIGRTRREKLKYQGLTPMPVRADPNAAPMPPTPMPPIRSGRTWVSRSLRLGPLQKHLYQTHSGSFPVSLQE
jgi:hypothetical protein